MLPQHMDEVRRTDRDWRLSQRRNLTEDQREQVRSSNTEIRSSQRINLTYDQNRGASWQLFELNQLFGPLGSFFSFFGVLLFSFLDPLEAFSAFFVSCPRKFSFSMENSAFCIISAKRALNKGLRGPNALCRS